MTFEAAFIALGTLITLFGAAASAWWWRVKRKEEILQHHDQHVVDEALKSFEDCLDKKLDTALLPLRKELQPNGGTSLKDTVNSLRVTVTRMDEENLRHFTSVEAHLERQDDRIDGLYSQIPARRN